MISIPYLLIINYRNLYYKHLKWYQEFPLLVLFGLSQKF